MANSLELGVQAGSAAEVPLDGGAMAASGRASRRGLSAELTGGVENGSFRALMLPPSRLRRATVCGSISFTLEKMPPAFFPA